jgi:hypothetical protein
VVFLYQTGANASKRHSGARWQDPENQDDNFFRVVTGLTQARRV